MNQIQLQEKKILEKARIIAASKKARRSEVNPKIWLIGSSNPRTPTRFYCVMWDEELDAFICDCAAFGFIGPTPCKHIYACAIYEGTTVSGSLVASESRSKTKLSGQSVTDEK